MLIKYITTFAITKVLICVVLVVGHFCFLKKGFKKKDSVSDMMHCSLNKKFSCRAVWQSFGLSQVEWTRSKVEGRLSVSLVWSKPLHVKSCLTVFVRQGGQECLGLERKMHRCLILKFFYPLIQHKLKNKWW